MRPWLFHIGDVGIPSYWAFLLIGLIAAVRRILVISVESAYIPEKFNNHMIEIGILGVLVFIFIIGTLFLQKQTSR